MISDNVPAGPGWYVYTPPVDESGREIPEQWHGEFRSAGEAVRHATGHDHVVLVVERVHGVHGLTDDQWIPVLAATIASDDAQVGVEEATRSALRFAGRLDEHGWQISVPNDVTLDDEPAEDKDDDGWRWVGPGMWVQSHDQPDPVMPDFASEQRHDIEELLDAIRVTQEYAQLPAIDGWAWWDTYRRFRPRDADRLRSEWQRARSSLQDRREPCPDASEVIALAVATTLDYVAPWQTDEDNVADHRGRADQIRRYQEIGWYESACCPVCVEVVCDDDCPLYPVRDAAGVWIGSTGAWGDD